MHLGRLHGIAPRLLAFFVAILLLGQGLQPSVAIAEPAKKTTVKKNTQKPATKKTAPKKAASKPAKKTNTSSNAAQKDLARIQQQIRSSENRIRLSKEQRDQKEAELREAEVAIGEIKENMGSLKEEASTHEEKLTKLRAERILHENNKARLKTLVQADLKMAQRQGGQDHYKLILNQQDPEVIARMMRYSGHLQMARGKRIQELNQTLLRLDEIGREEEKSLRQLKALQSDLQKKQTQLDKVQKDRNKTIRILSAQIESEDEKLQRLRRDQQALQSVIERLAREAAAREAAAREAEKRRQEQAAKTPPSGNTTPGTPTTPSKPPVVIDKPDYKLAPYTGRCALPVNGGVRANFGSARAGGLRWNGIVVAAASGTAVRAVLPGKVAFADYLRGYGFLIIVDHGRGLMSLYGQNQNLLKKAGEAVAANEVIARVGDSGGNETDGLYFEIRMRGKPVDPANWCAYQ